MAYTHEGILLFAEKGSSLHTQAEGFFVVSLSVCLFYFRVCLYSKLANSKNPRQAFGVARRFAPILLWRAKIVWVCPTKICQIFPLNKAATFLYLPQPSPPAAFPLPFKILSAFPLPFKMAPPSALQEAKCRDTVQTLPFLFAFPHPFQTYHRTVCRRF